MNFQSLYGPWALITGASSGLGEHYARAIAKKGLNLILIARRKERLENLASDLTNKHSIQTHVIALDLCEEHALKKIKEATIDKDIGLVINNAGFGAKSEFLKTEADTLSKMIKLNCNVPVMLTHLFLPQLKQRKRSGIINLASVVGFQASPFMSVYGATKGFDLLFSESLSEEFSESGVDVLAVCPGSTDTEFHTIAGSEATFPMLDDPKLVVMKSLKCLGKKSVYIHSAKYQILLFLNKILPRSIVAKVAKKIINR
jgi:short-subunit dehydrogenase|tara:strand:- start:467 stop:1240 length:774 start_codon:yes stop_codon:yes gene_type:complete